MNIQSINPYVSTDFSRKNIIKYNKFQQDKINFKGRHSLATKMAGICSVASAVGCIGGMLLTSESGVINPIAIPYIATTSAMSAWLGANVGKKLDKISQNNSKDKK